MEPDQLQHSVKALYGAGFDAKSYLRRFIDLDFPLPEPARESYTKLLFEHHQIVTLQNSVLNQHTYDSLTEITALLAEEFNFGLRQQQQHALRLAMTYRIVLAQWQMNFETLAFLSFLVALRMHDEASFQALMEGDITSIGEVEEFRDSLHVGVQHGATGIAVDLDEILNACIHFWKAANVEGVSPVEQYERIAANTTADVQKRFNNLDGLYHPSEFQKMIRVVQITQGMGPFFGND
jgi:hypothetical protein